MEKRILLALALLLAPFQAGAGRLDLGADYQGWNSNYQLPYSGWEFLAPFSLSYDLDKGFRVYGDAEFASGHYTDNYVGGTEDSLNALSDTILGTDVHFENFSVPAILNIAVNLPTGDPSWEARQANGGLPSAFVDSRYRGRGFGINALYGLSFPSGNTEFGVAAGYMYSSAFNPNYDLMPFTGNLKLSDSVFAALNFCQSSKNGESQFIRLSGYYFMPTQEAGVDSLQMGPNINASYSWVNPTALSLELGGQYFFSCQRPLTPGGKLVTEPHGYYAPRFYLTPSYAFGQFAVGLQAKYVLANGYDPALALYNGGGWLLGLQPAWKLPLDGSSSLRLTGSFSTIISHNEGVDASANRTDVNYYRWTFGTNYEIKL